jgi:hypothetical protein
VFNPAPGGENVAVQAGPPRDLRNSLLTWMSTMLTFM